MKIKEQYKSLDEITSHPFFAKMVEDITEERYGQIIIDPLHFVNVHHAMFNYLHVNIRNSYKTKTGLRSFKIGGEEYLIHLGYLISRSSTINNATKEEAKLCCDILRNECKRVTKKLWPEEFENFDYSRLKSELRKLKGVSEKIEHIEIILKDYITFKKPHFWGNNAFFEDYCEKDLEELYKLAKEQNKGEMQKSDTYEANNQPFLSQFTNPQIALIFRYAFQSMGIETKTELESNASDIARFIHLLRGDGFEKAGDSDIYKKLYDGPYFRKGANAQLLKDLKKIRPHFEKVGLSKVIELIDKEIKSAQD